MPCLLGRTGTAECRPHVVRAFVVLAITIGDHCISKHEYCVFQSICVCDIEEAILAWSH